MYQGITPEICDLAWSITLRSVIHAADMGVTNKLAGTVVVLDPFTGEVLFLNQVEPEHADSNRYNEIAMAKAQVSFSTGLNSRQVQQDAPHLYQEGMTKWGGAVIENNLVVAFSGVQAIFDEAIASTMLRWVVALCQYEMVKPDGVMSSESSYL